MRKVLIITYYWPPSAGSGVQRWLKFSKYLPENGWKPYVFTAESPSFDVKDECLLNDISPETEVWKSPIWEPYSLRDKIFGKSTNSNFGIVQDKSSLKNKILNWLRGNIFIPDPKVFWVRSSVKLLTKKIVEENITHMISTGPPHSMHLIALALKKKNPNIKWISDFRDPWSQLDILDDFRLTKRSRLKHQQLEKEVLLHSDICLTVSDTWKKSFKTLGANNVKVITNGFDEENFNTLDVQNDKFIIGHYGLLNHLRNPINLWKNLNTLCEDNPDFNEKLEIRLSGNIDTEVLQSITENFHLKNKIKILGYLSHNDVLSEYNKSSVLLLLVFNSESGKGNYPGKIFEYFAAKKPILGFGPENSDTEKLIKKTKSGLFFKYNELEFKEEILNLFENKTEFNSTYNLQDFSRRKLTKDLSDLLNNM